MATLKKKLKSSKESASLTSLPELTLEICKREGKKVNLPIAQISEVVTVLSEIMYEEADYGLKIRDMLVNNGKRRKRLQCKKP